MKARNILALGAAVVGLAGLVGCGNKENPREEQNVTHCWVGNIEVIAPACNNNPSVFMNDKGGYAITCGRYRFDHQDGWWDSLEDDGRLYLQKWVDFEPDGSPDGIVDRWEYSMWSFADREYQLFEEQTPHSLQPFIQDGYQKGIQAIGKEEIYVKWEEWKNNQ